MVFTQFAAAVKNQFAKMQSKNGNLFVSKLNGRDLTDLYLSSLEGFDPVFRDPNSTTHTCNHCKNFLRRYGNTVSINAAGEIETMFDNTTEEGDEYHLAAINIGNALRTAGIESEFIETFDELQVLPYEKGVKKSQSHFKLGVASNIKCYTQDEADKFGVVKAGETRTFNHFHAVLENKFVNSTGKSVAALVGESKDLFNLLTKAMKISVSTYEEVLDLIKSNAILNAETSIANITKIIALKKEMDTNTNKVNFTWLKSKEIGNLCRFINTLIGETIQKLDAGDDIEATILFYNKQADPANYRRASAPVSTKQKEEAQKFFDENGYMESLARRHATMDDINISEIRHVNRNATTSTKPMSLFDSIKTGGTGSAGTRKQFEKCDKITMTKFMEEILPNAERIEILFEGSQKDNLSIITTTVNQYAKPMFSWENNFSWTSKQNLAGKSFIKEAVKAQGGKVDGIFRASLSWAEDEPNNNTDLDLHCIEPSGIEISFRNKRSSVTGGNLDVDITQPRYDYNNKNIVENITYPNLNQMRDGIYKIFVQVWANRGGSDFTVEVEFNGQITMFKHTGSYSGAHDIYVCDVRLKNGVFTIDNAHLPFSEDNSKTQKVWNIDTNMFHDVSLVSLSPNYWGDSNVGNRHYFFAIKNCKTDEELRSFHNENLKPEFRAYRGTTELLGAHATVKPSPDQLAGLMFNATVQESVIVKATHNGVAKVYNVSTL